MSKFGLIFIIVALWMGAPLFSFSQTTIWVSPRGNDTARGSEDAPLASVQMAIRKARNLRRLNDPAIKQGIHIVLDTGRFFLQEPIVLRPEDSGTGDAPLTIEAKKTNQTIISGGFSIKGWNILKEPIAGLPQNVLGKIVVADVPSEGENDFNFRQLWVNGRKAVRAKGGNGDSMCRILNWDKKTGTVIVPLQPFAALKAMAGLEFFIHQWWEIADLRVRKLEKAGDSCRVYFYEPESHIQNEHPWPAPWISKETGNSAFNFVNSIQLLDEPGEWFYDIVAKKIYYYPLRGEDMRTADVIAPFLENILIVNGTVDHPVKNITIKGICFQNSSWLRPSLWGHVPHQMGMYMTEAYKLKPAGTSEKPLLDNQAWVGRPAAAIDISYAQNIHIEQNQFRHLASTGLDLHEGVQYSSIVGNVFSDIGGTGVLGGNYGEQGLEVHQVYRPKDERVVCDHIVVKNNLVTNVANEDWGCVGIGFGYAKNISIEHNEIENIPYSGISIGWGWTPLQNVMEQNQIRFNKIHHYGRSNYDCAGIYTLSSQPGTIIEQNVVDSIYKAPYAHMPMHWFYLYTDEGSSGITIKNNWTPSQKFLQNNNGPNNIWINNGPQVSDTIKKNAGLEVVYHDLDQYKTSGFVKQSINKERKELIELQVMDKKKFDLNKLNTFLKARNIKEFSLYNWKDHIVIYGFVQDLSVLKGQLQNSFKSVKVKTYQDLVYDFERAEHCADGFVTAQWETVVMTANLVSDPRKQMEYVNYHTTQFDKWPEVARGFCNAEFQQLLVFKNERQLMLLISIPKGKKLDELNPKTTENNPKVVEWNTMMKQYQEGIPGTKKGEVWVLLKQVY